MFLRFTITFTCDRELSWYSDGIPLLSAVVNRLRFLSERKSKSARRYWISQY